MQLQSHRGRIRPLLNSGCIPAANFFHHVTPYLITLASHISTSTNTHFDRVFSPPGDFQFSVSSDDNSEFWLSPDESPLNARLLVYVGQVSNESCCSLNI